MTCEIQGGFDQVQYNGIGKLAQHWFEQLQLAKAWLL